MEIISIITAGFGILFFIGLTLVQVPEKPRSSDYAMGSMPPPYTLWMMGIGLVGFFVGFLVLYFLGAFDVTETKYKKLEIEVPETIKVDTRFYQDSQEIYRECL